MNIRMLKHLAIVAALFGSVISVSVANAAIVAGSKVQMTGTALIDAAGNVSPRDELTGLTFPSPVEVIINANGNIGSFSGYNRLNPVTLPFAPNYTTKMGKIVSAGPFGSNLLSLPAVVLGAGEPGAAVQATFFALDSWVFNVVGSFFNAQGVGRILDGTGAFLANAEYQFSSQAFAPDVVNSFSATLTTTSVIPVPGAIWIFGSGLLLMTAVMRRKVR